MERGKSQRGVVLSKEKLRELAKLIRQNEEELIKRIQFKSEKDRSDYLQCSKETYNQVMALLDNEDEDGDEDTDDDATSSVKEVIHKYIDFLEAAVGFGMQTMKNIHLRNDFLSQVGEYAETLVPRLEELKNGTLEELLIESKAKALVTELSNFKESMLKAFTLKGGPVSRNFSRAIKLSGITFEDLISTYQKKLIREKGSSFDKPFDLLADEQKIEVYDEIIKASGRGSFLENMAYKVTDKIGKGLLIMTLAMTVWDIFSSEHKLHTLLKDGAELAGSWVVGYVGEIAADAAAAYLVTSLGVAETTITAAFVGLTMLVTGLEVVVGLGVLGVFVVDKIFRSGGKHTGGAINLKDKDRPKKNEVPNHPRYQQVYAAPMPDGALLARQLAYVGSPAMMLLN